MSLYEKIVAGEEKIALVGLGYVGMPIAVAFAKKVKVIGFDLNAAKIELYKQGVDPTKEVGDEGIKATTVEFIEEHYDVASFDLIHAYTLYTDGNAARVLSEKYGVPFVVAVRNTDVNDFLKKMIHLRKRGLKTLLAAKEVFFLSEAYRRQVFEKYVPQKYQEVIKKKTYIIPNGIDEFWFENTPEQGKFI